MPTSKLVKMMMMMIMITIAMMVIMMIGCDNDDDNDDGGDDVFNVPSVHVIVEVPESMRLTSSQSVRMPFYRST